MNFHDGTTGADKFRRVLIQYRENHKLLERFMVSIAFSAGRIPQRHVLGRVKGPAVFKPFDQIRIRYVGAAESNQVGMAVRDAFLG